MKEIVQMNLDILMLRVGNSKCALYVAILLLARSKKILSVSSSDLSSMQLRMSQAHTTSGAKIRARMPHRRALREFAYKLEAIRGMRSGEQYVVLD